MYLVNMAGCVPLLSQFSMSDASKLVSKDVFGVFTEGKLGNPMNISLMAIFNGKRLPCEGQDDSKKLMLVTDQEMRCILAMLDHRDGQRWLIKEYGKKAYLELRATFQGASKATSVTVEIA